MYRIILFLLTALWLHSCSFDTQEAEKPAASMEENEPEKEPVAEAPDEKDTIPEASPNDTVDVYPEVQLKDDYNDISLFLSGQKLKKNSPYYDLTLDSSFIKYAKSIHYNYKKYHDKQLVKISDWSKKELSEAHEKSRTVFYPFSGPDAVHALTVFPKGENYYLFGLEPVGDIPDLQNIPADSMNQLFTALNKSMSDNLNLSFFITKKMHKDLKSTYINGTIPVLLFFLSKLNYHVQDIKPAKITDAGAIEIKERSIKSNFTGFGKGVEITFVDTSTNEIKKLYYFSMDISDAGFKKYPGMQTFMNSLSGPVTTLIKSASYCMHGEKYQSIYNTVRDKSTYLLQDDTGIPFAGFNDKKWSISLYGSYEKPVKVFEEMYQEDFKKAMDERAQPVDFRFGYTKEANILFGVKK